MRNLGRSSQGHKKSESERKLNQQIIENIFVLNVEDDRSAKITDENINDTEENKQMQHFEPRGKWARAWLSRHGNTPEK